MSSVSAIRPSVEFSSGTMPNWTWRRLTSSKTAAIEPTGTCSTACRTWRRRPGGCSCIRAPGRRPGACAAAAGEPLISSRKISRRVSGGSGPVAGGQDLGEHLLLAGRRPDLQALLLLDLADLERRPRPAGSAGRPAPCRSGRSRRGGRPGSAAAGPAAARAAGRRGRASGGGLAGHRGRLGGATGRRRAAMFDVRSEETSGYKNGPAHVKRFRARGTAGPRCSVRPPTIRLESSTHGRPARSRTALGCRYRARCRSGTRGGSCHFGRITAPRCVGQSLGSTNCLDRLNCCSHRRR